MRKYVWTYPIVVMVGITLIAMLLQSCGVVRLDKIHEIPTLEEIDKRIRTATWILGSTLIVGFLLSAYIYLQVKKLDNRIIKLEKDRE